MKSYYTVEKKINIELMHEYPISRQEMLIMEAYVPGIKKSDQAAEPIHISVTYETSPEFAHVLYGMVRVELLKQKIFCVHGACVSLKKRILIVGHSGSGKTTVALHLLEQGWSLDSGNKTAVAFNDEKGISRVVGTTATSLKAGDTIPVLLASREKVRVWDRVIIADSEQMHDEAAISDTSIDEIVILKLNAFKDAVTTIEGASRTHLLYPYFLDVVNSDVIMDSVDSVFIGTPPQGTQLYLMRQLQQNTVPVYRIEGSLEFVSNAIQQL